MPPTIYSLHLPRSKCLVETVHPSFHRRNRGLGFLSLIKRIKRGWSVWGCTLGPLVMDSRHILVVGDAHSAMMRLVCYCLGFNEFFVYGIRGRYIASRKDKATDVPISHYRCLTRTLHRVGPPVHSSRLRRLKEAHKEIPVF